MTTATHPANASVTSSAEAPTTVAYALSDTASADTNMRDVPVATSSGVHHPEATATATPTAVYENTATTTSAAPSEPDLESSRSRSALNVQDALVYLEEVKKQFADRPDVYNRFLDIMKEFKSQAIDTPGVIERVLELFDSNMSLIIGFNTFLPPGYEIGPDPNGIRVTTPRYSRVRAIAHRRPYSAGRTPGREMESAAIEHGGASMHGQPHALPVKPPDTFDANASFTSPAVAGTSRFGSPSQGLPASNNAAYAPGTSPSAPLPYGKTVPGNNAPPATAMPAPMPSMHTGHGNFGMSSSTVSAGGGVSASSRATSVTATPTAQTMQSTTAARSHAGPAEFNHAITFVNKIKNRFASQPDIYKQFLEILQQYQRENKPLKEVYAHVQVLFRDEEDLLMEFKQFLPDPAATVPSGTNVMAPTPSVRMNAGSRLPPVGTFPAYNTAAVGQPVTDPYRKSSYPQVPPMQHTMMVANGSSMAAKKRRDAQTSILDGARKRHKQQSGSGTPSSMSDNKMSASADELVFFERVKRHLTNKQTYAEFIKILNLFSQEILDRKQVVERVEPFLSNRADLFDWFKMFVGYDGKEETIINEAPPREKLDLSRCKPASTSYRVLPLADQKLPCSGREDLSYEVINDKYVSHPTWASEDQEFIAHRKNQFEEAMHRCEEERYEYDLYIEANLHTIALLEPIARRIEMMTAEERAAFRLPDGLGGQSRTIYKRIIRRVYEDKAPEIIEQLQVNPSNTVPVVLARLKQKDEEWRRAQRESNKIWREVELRNYYKALDHQSINFKGNDKRALSHKTLMEKMEAIYKEQLATRRSGDPRPAFQFEFTIDDPDLIQDLANILLTCMDRQTTMSNTDRDHVEDFIVGFVKDFFNLRKIEPTRLHRMSSQRSEQNGQGSDVDRDDALSVASHDSDGESVSSQPSRRTRTREASLRRDVLTRRNAGNSQADDTEEDNGKQQDENNGGDADETGTHPSDQDTTMTNANAQEEGWLQIPRTYHPEANGDAADIRHIVCFGNNAFYFFFRLYQTLYSRLDKLKKLAAKETTRHKVNPVAEGMAIHYRLPTLSDYDLDHDNYYRIELDLIARLFAQELDKNGFEDSTRYLFGTQGYILFTVSHVAQSILRQIQPIVNDSTCLSLLEAFRQYGRGGPRQLPAYWAKAESLLAQTDDRLFKFEFDLETHQLRIQYIDVDNQFEDDVSSREERWARYVESYVALTPTVGVHVEREPYLSRNLPETLEPAPEDSVYIYNGLEAKICMNTYRLFFVKNRSDWFIRRKRGQSPNAAQQDRIHRHIAWRRWLDGPQGWKRQEDEVETTKEEETTQPDNTDAATNADTDTVMTDNPPSTFDPEAAEAQYLAWLTGEGEHARTVQHIVEPWANYRRFN